MIRIIFLSIVTLTLTCGNTRPGTAAEPTGIPATKQSEVPVIEVAEVLWAESHAEVSPSRTSESAAETIKTASGRTTCSTSHNAETAVAAEAIPTIAATETPEAETAITVEAIPIDDAVFTAEPTIVAIVSESTPPVDAPAVVNTPVEFTTAVRSFDKPILASRKHFLPTRRRMDREINKLKFAYKGEVMVGLTASYGTLSSDNADFLTILSGIDANATIATVKPFLGYFYSDNHAVGIRFGYSHVGGTVNSATFDLGPSNDLSEKIPHFNLKNDNYAFGIFHRSYAGLDPKGRFGLFAEFELSMSVGSSEFSYEQNGKPKPMYSDNMQLKLSFNPGAAVYIFPNVCATLSFGLGGIQYTSVNQKDADGNKIGSRKASKMNFKLNIAAINIGMNVHLWDKKKK